MKLPEQLTLSPKTKIIGIETPIITYLLFQAIRERHEREQKRKRFWSKVMFWKNAERIHGANNLKP